MSESPGPSAQTPMLKPEEEMGETGRESGVDVGGPQSPPPSYHNTLEENVIATNGAHHRHEEPVRGKRLQFNMASKIQIIPSTRQGQLNTAFLTTLPGVLKMAEIVVAFITYILAICSDRNSTTSAWTEHIAFESVIVVGLLLMGYVIFPHLTIKDEPTREGLILVELIFYGLNALMFFVAIWLMVHLSASYGTEGRGAAILAAILCVAMTVLFAIEVFHKFLAWRSETGSTQIVNNATTTEAGRRYETNAHLSRNNAELA